METALRSGHNELRAEELVTWKVAGRVNGISYITHTHTQRTEGKEKKTVEIIAAIAKEECIRIEVENKKERIL